MSFNFVNLMGCRSKVTCCVLVAILGWMHPALVGAQDKVGVGVPYLVDKIDPLIVDDPINALLLANLGRGLVRSDSNGDLHLEVAQSFATSEDGKLWEFSLRPNATFATSALVTADDVRAAYQMLVDRSSLKEAQPASRGRLAETPTDELKTDSLNPTRSFQPLRSQLANIYSIKTVEVSKPTPTKPGIRGVQFNLSQPDWNFPRVVGSLPLLNMAIATQAAQEHGIGTLFAAIGPYQLRENRSEGVVTLEKSPFFYETGLTGAGVVSIRTFEDGASALSALRTGGIDIIALPTIGQIAQLSDDPTLEAIDSPFRHMLPHGETWKLSREFWGNTLLNDDRLLLTKIIVRKSLKLDQKAHEYFDLSGTFLP